MIVGQNVQAGDFNALVVALESDTAYPGGEIRGQVHQVEDQQGQNQNQQGNQN